MRELEVFPNPFPENDYTVTHINEEFTSVCPITGLPDFAKVTLNIVPDELCVELKSLKYYYLDYRNQGIFYEAITNMILNDIVKAINPKQLEVITEWTVRGGMHTKVIAKHTKA